jgi:hypothetical protein
MKLVHLPCFSLSSDPSLLSLPSEIEDLFAKVKIVPISPPFGLFDILIVPIKVIRLKFNLLSSL